MSLQNQSVSSSRKHSRPVEAAPRRIKRIDPSLTPAQHCKSGDDKEVKNTPRSSRRLQGFSAPKMVKSEPKKGKTIKVKTGSKSEHATPSVRKRKKSSDIENSDKENSDVENSGSDDFLSDSDASPSKRNRITEKNR